MRSGVVLGLALMTALSAMGMDEPPVTTSGAGRFERAIAPLLAEYCLECHAGAEPRGELDLTTRAAALRGGSSGVVLVPGKPEESLLWEHVEGGAMPPKVPLPDSAKTALRQWIVDGLPWGPGPIDPLQYTTHRRAGRDWWAFQPVARPALPPPPSRDDAGSRNPIDLWARAKLRSEGLEPSPEADRRTLVRRLTFDLLGLPPTPDEVDAFVADERPGAYERLVDRLLASPHYGARWARSWLDLARYGESNGFEHDEFRPGSWRYRDWVVNALNRDLPYDQFARWQLAGDVLSPGDAEAVAATGFLVAGAYDSVGQTQQSEAMRRVVRQDELEDIVGTVGQTFLGLTVHCARCHDHKFDPIPQVEYYRLASALSGVRHGVRDLTALDPKARRARQRLGAAALQPLALALGLATAFDPSVFQARTWTEGLRPYRAYVVTPREPGPTHRLIRGNPGQPGEVVSPGGVAVVSGGSAEFHLAADAPEAQRRIRLANWLTDRDNPLFARVIVNRLWQAHFGAGLVESPSDFGFNGGQPSHPELLDWLASELVRADWSLKAVHRLIVTSATYRQSSRAVAAGLERDADNRFLWRKAPFRLEAEMVRDAMLSVSGALNPAMGGPGFREFAVVKAPGTITNLYVPVAAIGPEFDRRTLYRAWARGGRNGFLDAFDCPDPSTTAPRRASTTTPLQALALLNNAAVLRLAERFGARLRREAGPGAPEQVTLAYRLAFGRAPSNEEREAASRVVERFGGAALARAIFNTNEFLYVD